MSPERPRGGRRFRRRAIPDNTRLCVGDRRSRARWPQPNPVDRSAEGLRVDSRRHHRQATSADDPQPLCEYRSLGLPRGSASAGGDPPLVEGTADETTRALELGCYFSLNGSEANNPRVLELLPPERVLTETDYPHSHRTDPVASRPAAVKTIEAALEVTWGVNRHELRELLWQNLETLVHRAGSASQLPARTQRDSPNLSTVKPESPRH